MHADELCVCLKLLAAEHDLVILQHFLKKIHIAEFMFSCSSSQPEQESQDFINTRSGYLTKEALHSFPLASHRVRTNHTTIS